MTEGQEIALCARLPPDLQTVLRRAKVSLDSEGIFSVIPVCIGPGQTAFIVTPDGPSSTANALVKPTTPCLEAV